MNSIVWHIVKKDFRHLRGLVAAYWLVLAIYFALPWWLLNRAQSYPWIATSVPNSYNNTAISYNITELYLYIGFIEFFLFWAGAVLVAVVGVRLVLADSPGVENAQWRTLPVTRFKMLAAKILSLTLMTALPYTGCGAMAKILQGAPMIEWLDGSGMAFILTLFWAVPGILAASLFESTTLRVIFLLGLIGVGLMIEGTAANMSAAGVGSHLVMCVVIFFVLGAGLILLRYLGLGKAACTCVLVVVMIALWLGLPTLPSAMFEKMPYTGENFGPGFMAHVSYLGQELPIDEVAQPSITIQPAGFTISEYSFRGVANEYRAPHFHQYIALEGQIKGLSNNLPKGEIALLDFWELDRASEKATRWVRGNSYGESITSSLSNANYGGLPLNLPDLAAAAGLGRVHFYYGDDMQPDRWPIMMLSETDHLKVPMPTNLTGTLHYQTGTYQRVAEIPLQAGSRMTLGSTNIVFLRMEISSFKHNVDGQKGAKISLRTDLYFGRQWAQINPWPNTGGNSLLPATFPRDYYFLYNLKRAECFTIETDTYWGFAHHFQVFDIGFNIGGEMGFAPMSYFENGQEHFMTEDEAKAWLADAKLVVVEFTPKHFYQAPATFGPLEHPPVADNP